MLRPSVLAGAVCLALLAIVLSSQAAAAASITVTTLNDELNTNGKCSLREAIVNANANNQSGSADCTAGSGDDTIILPSGTILLTVSTGPNSGDLDLTSNITINGVGANQTFIDGAGLSPRDRVFDVASGATVTMSKLTVRNGQSSGDGGGIRNAGTLTLRDVIVTDNKAGDDGGGVSSDGDLTLIRTSIRKNTSTDDAGGLLNEGTATMTDGDISDNHSLDDAGGVRNEGTLRLTRVIVSHNISDDTAGGIENLGDLTITDSTIDRNQAVDDGGGIQNSNGTLGIDRSAITNNTTGEDGGGIDMDGGTIDLLNVTISGNSAAIDGGGFETSDGGTVSMSLVTFANNTAGHGNSLFNDPSDPSTVTFANTIFASGPSGSNCAGASINSLGHNLEFPGTTCQLTGPGDITGADPRLGPLANNGGPTRTHALLSHSPAIDAASSFKCTTVDQRGEGRPVDGDGNGSAICDIGAFEVQPPGASQAHSQNDPNNDDEKKDKKKETEEQRQQRERTNASNKDEYHTEGNVLAVDRGPGGTTLLVTIGLSRNETLIVQVTCPDQKCPDIRTGDYLEADGYQNGVGDPNAYFIAEDVTVSRGGKKVK